MATVDASGLVTAVAAGSATITATTAGLSADCAVTVVASAQSLSVSPSATEVTAP